MVWFLPEIISLIANTADVFMESTVRLYILKAECEKRYPFNTDCLDIGRNTTEYNEIQESVSEVFMWNRLLQEIPIFFILPVCGSWADTAGRKLPIAISSMASAFSALAYLISTYDPSKYLYLVLLGSALRGISCKGGVVIVAVSSMVADTTKEEDRTWRLSVLLSTKYIGNILGLLLQAALLNRDMFSTVLLLNVVAYCLITLLALTLVSAKSSENQQRTTSNQLVNGLLVHYTDVFKVISQKPKNGSLLSLWILLIVTALDRVCKTALTGVLILVINLRFPEFTNVDYSWYFMTEASISVILATVVIYVLAKYVANNLIFFIVGCIFGIVKNLFLSLADSIAMLYVGIIVGTGLVFLVASIRSQISQMVDYMHYGKIFAFILILETVSNIFGSLTFLEIHRALYTYFSGIVFMLCAILYIVMLILLIIGHKNMKRDERELTESEEAGDCESQLIPDRYALNNEE